MQQLSIKVRARSSIEASNLGLICARKYFFSLLWVSLPIWLVIVSAAVWLWVTFDSAQLAIITIWWFKPLYERPALKQLSDLIFTQKTDFWQVQKAAFAQGFIAEITYKRLFASNRIIRHAINLLEGVKARERGQRVRMCATIGGALRWVLALPLFEVLLIYTIIAFLPGLPELPKLHELVTYNPDNQAPLTVILFYYNLMTILFFAVSLISSIFFVSIGFMLYLNSRIIHEGWAIALDMQALAKRLLSLCVIILGLCSSFILSAPNAFAITQAEQAQDKQWLEEIINDPDLTPYEVRTRRVPRLNSDQRTVVPSFDESVAEYVRLLLIFLLVIAIFVLVWQIKKQVHLRTHHTLKHPQTRGKATQEILQNTYPIDSLDKATQFWQNGDMLSALAVLYTRLAGEPEKHQIMPFSIGETESDYLARTQTQIAQTHHDFLRELFSLWQSAAYAQHKVSAATVGGLIRQYRAIWP